MLTNKRKKACFILLLISVWQVELAKGQITYPYTQVDQSYLPPSPNAQAFQTYGNDPVSLFDGTPSYNIPIYDIKCGSLSMPITLSYNYNGFSPLQDAGWVGLGWNLNVGGVISRIVEGRADSSQTAGMNYGQYDITDSIHQGFQAASDFLSQQYDLAPDIFDVEFTGGSGKFIWYNGKPYLLDFNKQLGINWPSVNGNITITTDNGTIYIFGAKEITTSNTYHFGQVTSTTNFNSAWHLSMVISADKKDTITLNYAPYTWQQAQLPYQDSYTMSGGSQADLGYDTTSYKLLPSIQAQVLQSITWRNARINFVATSLRTDVIGSYPSLQEIEVIDSVTANTVRKHLFAYEYFGQTATNPQAFEHLKLKRFNTVNTLNSADTLTYSFSYINEYGTNFPVKTTQAVDDWGYFNGKTGNNSLLPASSSPYYTVTPTHNFASSNDRGPDSVYSTFAALDTVVYPTSGYTVFHYKQNYYQNFNNSTLRGPGICLSSTANYDRYKPGVALQKNYSYFKDDGITSSGILVNSPKYSYATYTTIDEDAGTSNNYSVYAAPANSAGIGGISPKFYYAKVSESITSGSETHKSDYYFTGFNTLFQDVRLAKKIDYANLPNTNYYSPVSEVDNSYAVVTDTSFLAAVAFIVQEDYKKVRVPKIIYTYSYFSNPWTTYWIHPTSQTTIQYDVNANTATTTATYNYNTQTRNLNSTQQSTSDGQLLVQKFKYPEDYDPSITNNMVASRVLNPAIEKETWIKRDANDSALIAGEVVQFDQTIFKPVATYGIETTAPIQNLSNETTSGGKYTSLLSTSQYILKGQIQYDGNNYPSTTNKSSDIKMSYIWDYKHSKQVALVSNAAQADIAFTSFEADGSGNWTYSGTPTSYPTSPVPPTGNNCYNLGQSSGSLTKSSLNSSTAYIVSYWTTNSSALTISGTQSGYPVQGKTINGWTYFEHKVAGQSSVTVGGTGFIDEVRLYPADAQMSTSTYSPLIGITSTCDAQNRVTYYQYDGFGRLKHIKDQDGNIIKTIEYHYSAR